MGLRIATFNNRQTGRKNQQGNRYTDQHNCEARRKTHESIAK